MFIYSKLTVQFYTISDHSEPVVAHGVMADQLSPFERYRLRVFYRSRNTCCLSLHRRTQAEFRLPTSRFTTSPGRFSWESIAYWRYFLEASVVPSLHRLRSHCKCGVLSLCISKELNWINTEAAKKIPQWQLSFCLLSTASSSLGRAMFSLLSSSSLLLALNFNWAFCCCFGENLHPHFPSVVYFFR